MITLLWIFGIWFNLPEMMCETSLGTLFDTSCESYFKTGALINLALYTLVDIYFAHILLRHADQGYSGDYYREH